jgi:hypothetical protein
MLTPRPPTACSPALIAAALTSSHQPAPSSAASARGSESRLESAHSFAACAAKPNRPGLRGPLRLAQPNPTGRASALACAAKALSLQARARETQCKSCCVCGWIQGPGTIRRLARPQKPAAWAESSAVQLLGNNSLRNQISQGTSLLQASQVVFPALSRFGMDCCVSSGNTAALASFPLIHFVLTLRSSERIAWGPDCRPKPLIHARLLPPAPDFTLFVVAQAPCQRARCSSARAQRHCNDDHYRAAPPLCN